MKTSLLLTSLLALAGAATFAQDAGTPPPSAPPPSGTNAPKDGENPGEHHGPQDAGGRSMDGGRRLFHMHDGMGFGMPAGPLKMTPYIGVITNEPPDALRAQLNLGEGFGLVVAEVLPDSPAAKGGLQRFDVLTKFNDQLLVDSAQLSVLVRSQKKGAAATLTLIRKGQEQTTSITIDERMLPARRTAAMGGEAPSARVLEAIRHGDAPAESAHSDAGRIQRNVREFGERLRQTWGRATGEGSGSGKHPPTPPPGQPLPLENNTPKLPQLDVPQPIAPEEILREARPGGVATIRLLQPNGEVRYNIADAKIFLKDDAGEVEVTTHNGQRSLVARDADGKTVFDGPIDTEEQRKGLPDDVRKKLERIDVHSSVSVEAAAAGAAVTEVQ